MKISYIPATSIRNVPDNLPGTLAAGNQLSEAIEEALRNAIVIPIKEWCYGTWKCFVRISLPACIFTSLFSLVLYMIGVKKARQWIIIPIIVYIFLRFIDGMII